MASLEVLLTGSELFLHLGDEVLLARGSGHQGPQLFIWIGQRQSRNDWGRLLLGCGTCLAPLWLALGSWIGGLDRLLGRVVAARQRHDQHCPAQPSSKVG